MAANPDTAIAAIPAESQAAAKYRRRRGAFLLPLAAPVVFAGNPDDGNQITRPGVGRRMDALQTPALGW